MSSNKSIEKPNSASARQQTTSTPNDDKKTKRATLPGSTDVSFMNTSRDDPQIDSFVLNQKVPSFNSLLNGTSTSKNLSNSQSVATDGSQGSNMSREIVVRMAKLVINNDAIDEELRVRENYLNQLKSIDLSKYSFPNEYKL